MIMVMAKGVCDDDIGGKLIHVKKGVKNMVYDGKSRFKVG
jgi:hypothetical protein